MTELLYLYGCDGATDTYDDTDFNTIAERIQPANAPAETEIWENKHTKYCLIHPSDVISTQGSSVCLGQMIPSPQDWHKPGGKHPDGSYGIARCDANRLEVLSDPAGSRTLYYYKFDDLFAVSTSERAIMHLLDEFVPDEQAIAWMISSGTLGPKQSWDERIKCLPPDSRLELDRSSWELTIETTPVHFESSATDHRSRLIDSLDETFSSMNIDLSQWALPLSGGYDSRELLLRFRDDPELQTITWGTNSALDQSDSDAAIAKALANEHGVSHRYFSLPESPTDIGSVFSRFVTASEGRIDHFSGYTDGLELFGDLATGSTEGIIRGDEGFGWVDVKYSQGVRRCVGAKMISDYDRLQSLPVPGRGAQCWPDDLQKGTDESLSTWRDRLYHSYRMPVVLSSLSSIKTPYVEIVNPFLCRRVLEPVREFPDELRTEKQLYKEYVLNRSPDIPIADRGASPSEEMILNSGPATEFLISELDTHRSRRVFSGEIIDPVLDELMSSDQTQSEDQSNVSMLDGLKRSIGERLPTNFVRQMAYYTPVDPPSLSISDGRLAFRLYMIANLHNKLREDTKQL